LLGAATIKTSEKAPVGAKQRPQMPLLLRILTFPLFFFILLFLGAIGGHD
jgi:hypothetical protein